MNGHAIVIPTPMPLECYGPTDGFRSIMKRGGKLMKAVTTTFGYERVTEIPQKVDPS